MPWECAGGWAGYADCSPHRRGSLFRGVLKHRAPCYKDCAITDPDRQAGYRSVPSSEWGPLNVSSYQLPRFSLPHTDF